MLPDDRSDVGEQLGEQRFALSVKLGSAASIGICLEVTLLVQGRSGLASGPVLQWVPLPFAFGSMSTVPRNTTPNFRVQ